MTRCHYDIFVMRSCHTLNVPMINPNDCYGTMRLTADLLQVVEAGPVRGERGHRRREVTDAAARLPVLQHGRQPGVFELQPHARARDHAVGLLPRPHGGGGARDAVEPVPDRLDVAVEAPHGRGAALGADRRDLIGSASVSRAVRRAGIFESTL